MKTKNYFLITAMLFGIFFSITSSFAFDITIAKDNEKVTVQWPDNENWKKLFEADEKDQNQIRMGRFNDNGDLIETGGVKLVYGMSDLDLVQYAENIYDVQKKSADPSAKFRINKENLSINVPNVVFMLRTKDFKGNKVSQVWVLIQGKKGVYEIFRSLNKAKPSNNDLNMLGAFILKNVKFTSK